jgi:type III secretion system FlhB-like substrate exporter
MSEEKKKRDLAIGLKMEKKGEVKLPKVSVSAAGELARKIVEIAKENEIPLVKDTDLAQDMYLLEVGSYLPEKLFPAVAEIIAHIHHISALHNPAPKEKD